MDEIEPMTLLSVVRRVEERGAMKGANTPCSLFHSPIRLSPKIINKNKIVKLIAVLTVFNTHRQGSMPAGR